MIGKTKIKPLFFIVSLMLFAILVFTTLIISNKAPTSPDTSPLPPNESVEQSFPLIDLDAPRQFKTATFSLG